MSENWTFCRRFAKKTNTPDGRSTGDAALLPARPYRVSNAYPLYPLSLGSSLKREKIMIRTVLAVAAAATMSLAVPAMAQETPLKPGDYWEIAAIDVEDGHSLTYGNWLATEWRQFNEYAKSQGWITDYKILTNLHNRSDEGDVYLITKFKSLPNAAEIERRDAAFRAAMQRTSNQLASQSGKRAEYRDVMGSMLLQEMHFRN